MKQGIRETSLPALFPVPSQTSENDKHFLLQAQALIRDVNGKYAYMEVGSFLGGSLVPFLRDEACSSVLSVDERGRAQPDERGVLYDYSGVTTETMLERLHSEGIATDKLIAHDASVDRLPKHEGQFDLAFIDGEHTDEACFRDFLYVLRMVRKNAIIMFHDSTLIYKCLKLIRIYLMSIDLGFVLAKKRGSEMSAVFLGKFVGVPFEERFGPKDNIDEFFLGAEAAVLKSNVRHRVRLGFGGKRLLRFKVNPPRVYRARSWLTGWRA